MQTIGNYREVLEEHSRGRYSVMASWIVLTVLFGLVTLI